MSESVTVSNGPKLLRENITLYQEGVTCIGLTQHGYTVFVETKNIEELIEGLRIVRKWQHESTLGGVK